MNGFIMAPAHNKEGRADATGAFHIGAAKFQKVHSLPAWVKFENNEASKTSDTKGFLKKIQDQPGGWDVFAYFGHGNNNALGSADVRGRKGATALADTLRPKCNVGVVIMLYACNTGAPGGFAEWLANDLAGVEATVYAHVPPPGHTYQNANVVMYPGGEAVIPRSSPLWKDWYKDFHDDKNDLWARFPFMSMDELEAELLAPGGLMGRWEVRGKSESWQEVFFGDKTVYRIDADNPYMIAERGTWNVVRHNLTVSWPSGTTEDWPLALTLKQQTVKHRVNGSTTTMTARRIEAPNVNERRSFHSPFKMKQSKLIKV